MSIPDLNEPKIETTEHGWVWITDDGERHELHATFLTVHLHTKNETVGGMI